MDGWYRLLGLGEGRLDAEVTLARVRRAPVERRSAGHQPPGAAFGSQLRVVDRQTLTVARVDAALPSLDRDTPSGHLLVGILLSLRCRQGRYRRNEQRRGTRNS